MLYDLNIAWSPSTPASTLENTLRFAKNLGYDVVALNHLISNSIPTQPPQSRTRFHNSHPLTPPFPGAPPRQLIANPAQLQPSAQPPHHPQLPHPDPPSPQSWRGRPTRRPFRLSDAGREGRMLAQSLAGGSWLLLGRLLLLLRGGGRWGGRAGMWWLRRRRRRHGGPRGGAGRGSARGGGAGPSNSTREEKWGEEKSQEEEGTRMSQGKGKGKTVISHAM